MKGHINKITKMLTVATAAIFLLGSANTVSAKTLAGGNTGFTKASSTATAEASASGTSSTGSASSSSSSTKSSTSAAASGTTKTTVSKDGADIKTGNNASTSTGTTGAAGASGTTGTSSLNSQKASTSTSSTSSVQTGYFEDNLPFIISICASCFLVLAFAAGLLRRVRAGKKMVYSSEMEEFRKNCRV